MTARKVKAWAIGYVYRGQGSLRGRMLWWHNQFAPMLFPTRQAARDYLNSNEMRGKTKDFAPRLVEWSRIAPHAKKKGKANG